MTPTDWVTLAMAAAALVAAVLPRRSKTMATTFDVAAMMHEYGERIDHLERELASTRADLAAARAEIERLHALETRLEQIIESRDDEVVRLKNRLDGYRRRLKEAEDRIQTLEDWIRAQGVDPEDIEGTPI